MRTLVTGAAGFIGSHLSERLLDEGHEVLGVDAFTDYYDRARKERNVVGLRDRPGFTLIEADLESADLPTLVDDCDVIFHLAGQPGVRGSWGPDFRLYLERNVWATQRLLEAVRGSPLHKFVLASSSSVYGDAERYPTSELDLPRPISPYGVTKLAAERLCLAYHSTYGVPVMALRYFTVYGPRQRPDMAFSRFIEAIDRGQEIVVYGDGAQTRDFTFVADAVDGTYRAALGTESGHVLNIGGGACVALIDVLRLLGEATGREPKLRFIENQAGDVRHTAADITQARGLIGYEPRVILSEGLRRQVEDSRLAVV
ncbi:MAG: NAD-dependent epimerase/dehydratase family protein [Chloroflexota bacterium]